MYKEIKFDLYMQFERCIYSQERFSSVSNNFFYFLEFSYIIMSLHSNIVEGKDVGR